MGDRPRKAVQRRWARQLEKLMDGEWSWEQCWAFAESHSASYMRELIEDIKEEDRCG